MDDAAWVGKAVVFTQTDAPSHRRMLLLGHLGDFLWHVTLDRISHRWDGTPASGRILRR